MKDDQTTNDSNTDDGERKYRAPALEKGLDILELLSRHGAPMTTSQMATTLGRSVSELFRMVLALEFRGYIAPSVDGRDGYTLTNKLFTLGISQGSREHPRQGIDHDHGRQLTTAQHIVTNRPLFIHFGLYEAFIDPFIAPGDQN